METNFKKKNKTPEDMFKSYYVVWKLANMGRIIPIFVTFKSYYVVWKLFQAPRVMRRVFLFKSYYVVWKQARRKSKY